MTKDQLDALIEFVRDIANTAVNDPLGEAGAMYQAEKRLRAAFTVEPEADLKGLLREVLFADDQNVDTATTLPDDLMDRIRSVLNRGAEVPK